MGGFDANLELPLADPYWASLFQTEHCQVTSTVDLDALTAALLKHQYDFSYLPSANCFFLRAPGAASPARCRRARKPPRRAAFLL
jgi:hypothetical protein